MNLIDILILNQPCFFYQKHSQSLLKTYLKRSDLLLYMHKKRTEPVSAQ